MSFTFSANLPPETDTNLFAWQRIERESALPHAVVKVGGKYYLAYGFRRTVSECLIKNVTDMRDALLFSISLHSGVTLPELSAIAHIAEKLKIELQSLQIFEIHGIKGTKNIETLKKMLQLPEHILKYLDERPLSLKTLALLTSFDNNAVAFVAAFIAKSRPSVQALKIFIESTADFREELTACNYAESYKCPDRRSSVHKEIDDALKKLVTKAMPIRVTQPDNFETGKLFFSFEVADNCTYAKSVAKLEDVKDEVALLCELMKKHDIY